MKLLVMGAGYVGMALLQELQSQPHELSITTTQAERVEQLKPYGKEVILLDSSEEEELRVKILACDGMIVLVAPNNSRNYNDTYLNTAKMISSILQDRTTPFYLLYTSSTSVCEGLEGWVTEETSLNPQSENAQILLETERCYLNSRATTCILRLGGIYGPHRELPDRARRLSGKEMPGTGDEPTNNVHRDDIVSAILYCLTHRLAGVYQMVNDDHTPRRVLYSTLCQSLDIPEPTWNPQLSKGRGGSYKISNEKIKDAGFVFKHHFLDLKSTASQ